MQDGRGPDGRGVVYGDAVVIERFEQLKHDCLIVITNNSQRQRETWKYEALSYFTEIFDADHFLVRELIQIDCHTIIANTSSRLPGDQTIELPPFIAALSIVDAAIKEVQASSNNRSTVVEIISLKWSKERAARRLLDLITEGNKLCDMITDDVDADGIQSIWDDWTSWDDAARAVLGQMFQSDAKGFAAVMSQHPKNEFGRLTSPLIMRARISGVKQLNNKDGQMLTDELRDETRKKVRKLADFRSTLEDYEGSSVSEKDDSENDMKKIFIVHGRNEGHKFEVSNFIRDATGLRPRILADVASEGDNLLDKLARYVDSSNFAVVIMSGDDFGYLASESDDRKKPRARQNVVFELGFCIAKLGKKNVTVLHEEGVDIPSDFNGVVYISLSQDWKMELVRELKAAGVDASVDRTI
ncbi:nucleotide-binding protein [uncultured Actinomyces sp.]|uniref:nucleotide-binding protein n=1 Tax=uncultured Actinomyces sp. TaxID=249061 RepID=UPI002624A7D5|nr:nucleotide-binding protein [uncultured Actinomyces sp.]